MLIMETMYCKCGGAIVWNHVDRARFIDGDKLYKFTEREPYCEDCGKVHGESVLFPWIGNPYHLPGNNGP